MESPTPEVVPQPPKVHYIINTVVESVKPTDDDSGDHWVHFEGSRESLWFPGRPYEPGDKVKITFEKLP